MRSLLVLLCIMLAACGPSPSGLVHVYVECPTCACRMSWPGGDTVLRVQEAVVFQKGFRDTLDYQVRIEEVGSGAPAMLSIHQGAMLVCDVSSPTPQGNDTALVYTGRTWRSWP